MNQNTNNQHSNQQLHLNYQNTLKENINLLTQSTLKGKKILKAKS